MNEIGREKRGNRCFRWEKVVVVPLGTMSFFSVRGTTSRGYYGRTCRDYSTLPPLLLV